MNITGNKKVLCFGELLLRICPDGTGNWLISNQVPVYLGGAEANVATALALWDIPSAYLTALPQNQLSTQLKAQLEQQHIDLSRLVYEDGRMGIYYLSMGTDMKNTTVIYDRDHSAFANLRPGRIDWEQVFEDISWFHFSAICPAINENIALVCKEALLAANKKGIRVSLDLNYRAKLWKYGKLPVEVMKPLAEHCQLIMGNIWAASLMLGIDIREDLIAERNKEALLLQAEQTSVAIQQQFPSCEAVANTFRFDKGAGIQYYTSLFTGNTLYVSQAYQSEKVENKVGSGDCYMAGLIYGSYLQHPPQEIVDFATAAAYDKLFISTDATTTIVKDIRKHLNKSTFHEKV